MFSLRLVRWCPGRWCDCSLWLLGLCLKRANAIRCMPIVPQSWSLGGTLDGVDASWELIELKLPRMRGSLPRSYSTVLLYKPGLPALSKRYEACGGCAPINTDCRAISADIDRRVNRPNPLRRTPPTTNSLPQCLPASPILASPTTSCISMRCTEFHPLVW